MALQPFVTELPVAECSAVLVDALRGRPVLNKHTALVAVNVLSYGCGTLITDTPTPIGTAAAGTAPRPYGRIDNGALADSIAAETQAGTVGASGELWKKLAEAAIRILPLILQYLS